MVYFNIYSMFSKFFSKYFKQKEEQEVIIVTHTHQNVDEFIASFGDTELNALRSELISCDKSRIPEQINEILDYLKDKCTEEDLKWYAEEIRKEYKNN